jgi:hypothetical protein
MSSMSFKQLGNWLKANEGNNEHIFVHRQEEIRTYGLNIPILRDCKTILDKSDPKNKDKQPIWV